MAGKAKKKPDEYLAHRLEKEAFKYLQKLLVFIGKPLYFLLTSLIVFLFFVTYWIGHSLRIFIVLFIKLLVKIIQRPKFPSFKFTFKLPRPKITFPKISRPGIIISLLLIFLAYNFWFFILRGLPSPTKLTNYEPEVSTKIYDRNGVLLYKIYKNQNRTPVALSEIPQQVRLATLAAEDAEFYNHMGFSPKGIARAFLKNIKKGQLVGGSTITQQLIKNTLLSSEKTLTRKIRELILSVATEFILTKDQILEMYLNQVAYGGTAYGIEEAAQLYFGKKVADLTLAEAAFLAGLPKSPTKYSPFTTTQTLALARQKEVLHLMAVNNYISSQDAETAGREELNFAAKRIDIKAPHFVMFVKEQLVNKYGEEMVEKGGLRVTTTLDYRIQQMVEAVVANEIAKLTAYKVGNAAVIVLNPKSGEILAMVGSKDYFNIRENGNVNVTTAVRPPGSSIKIVNYAYALGHGYTPASTLDDTPVSFAVPGQPVYSPKNYDGVFRGPLTLREAFAQSRNVPAVKVLASYGVDKMLELGRQMGITSWNDPSRFGLSLTLGGGEVKLIDLATVYATVANYGKRPAPTSILTVANHKGKVLADNTCAGQNCGQPQVLDPRVAFLLIDILHDNPARAPEFGINSSLVIPDYPEVVVKTGTSNDLRDNLTVGFNQDYLTAVWVGNNNNSPMSRIASGITGAAPIWNKIMRSLLTDQVSKDWPPPDGLVRIQICSFLGTLPCAGCPTRMEWFLEENRPKIGCLIKKEEIDKNKILKEGASTQL